MNDQKALRQHLKNLRLALSAKARAEATAAVTARVVRLPQFRRARRVAGYFGSKGELDAMPLIEQAEAWGKQCFLPVLHPFRHGQLQLYRWRPGDRLLLNRFEIPEPVPCAENLIAARNLDLAIVPLLGFDSDCNRIGMGGGYYDRSFAFTRRFKHLKGPYMLGLAHESQRVDRLRTQTWDITLDAVVTERICYYRNSKE